MPPIVTTNTARLLVEYVVGTRQHHVLFRFPTGTSAADAVTEARAVCNAVKVLMYNSMAFNAARFAPAGSVVTTPAAWGAQIVGTGVAGFSPHEAAQFISFVGRDSSGVRTKLTFFGYVSDMSANYRIQASADAGVAATLAELTNATVQHVTVAGLAPVWNSYANAGFNAYWQRKLRRS